MKCIEMSTCLLPRYSSSAATRGA